MKQHRIGKLACLVASVGLLASCQGTTKMTERAQFGGQSRRVAASDLATTEGPQYSLVNLEVDLGQGGSANLTAQAVTHVTYLTSGGEACWKGGDMERANVPVSEPLVLNERGGGCGLLIKEIFLGPTIRYAHPTGFDVFKSDSATFVSSESQSDVAQVTRTIEGKYKIKLSLSIVEFSSARLVAKRGTRIEVANLKSTEELQLQIPEGAKLTEIISDGQYQGRGDVGEDVATTRIFIDHQTRTYKGTQMVKIGSNQKKGRAVYWSDTSFGNSPSYSGEDGLAQWDNDAESTCDAKGLGFDKSDTRVPMPKISSSGQTILYSEKPTAQRDLESRTITDAKLKKKADECLSDIKNKRFWWFALTIKHHF
jgi:hypothetical protein